MESVCLNKIELYVTFYVVFHLKDLINFLEVRKVRNSYLFDFDKIEGFQDYCSEIWQDDHQNSKEYNAQCQHHQKAHPHIEEGKVLLIDNIQRKYADGIMFIFLPGKSKSIKQKWVLHKSFY